MEKLVNLLDIPGYKIMGNISFDNVPHYFKNDYRHLQTLQHPFQNDLRRNFTISRLRNNY